MKTPDVLVIGAGIVGAACAWELAQEGLAVEIVDGGTVGGGATAEGMGHLVAMDDSPAQLALTSYSLDLWHALAPDLPSHCEMTSCGTLWVAQDEEDLKAMEQKASLYQEHGIDHQILDHLDLQEAEPCLHGDLPGALRVPNDAVVYPPAVAGEWIRRACREHHARCRLGTAVRLLGGGEAGQDPHAILKDGTRLTAGWIVNAAGRYALDLLPEPLPTLTIAPRKGHLLITNRRPGFCRHQLVELGYLKSAHGGQGESVAFNLQPRPNGQLLLGSSRQYGSLSRTVETPLVQRMVQRALHFVPGLRGLDVLRIWTGFRAATADYLPILGPVPRRPKILLAAGHEGLGITTSLGSARLISDQLLGLPSQISPTPYSANRVLADSGGDGPQSLDTPLPASSQFEDSSEARHA